MAKKPPEYKVIVWVRKDKHFDKVRAELLSIAKTQPNITVEPGDIIEFSWGVIGRFYAELLYIICWPLSEKQEILFLRISSLTDALAARNDLRGAIH
jgi:hypothetical protein